MHAFLINASSDKAVNEKVENLKNKFAADVINFPIYKVSDVRDLNILLKKRFPRNTIIFAPNFQNTNPIAANAFLKTLEEGSNNIIFVLSTNNINKILPTIVSRCFIINVTDTIETDLESEKFVKLSEEDQLDYISNIKKRSDAQDFLSNLIKRYELLIIDNPENFNGLIADLADETLVKIEANANPYLQLSNMVIQANNN